MMQRPVFFSSQPTPFLVLFQENKKSCAETKFQHSPTLFCGTGIYKTNREIHEKREKGVMNQNVTPV